MEPGAGRYPGTGVELELDDVEAEPAQLRECREVPGDSPENDGDAAIAQAREGVAGGCRQPGPPESYREPGGERRALGGDASELGDESGIGQAVGIDPAEQSELRHGVGAQVRHAGPHQQRVEPRQPAGSGGDPPVAAGRHRGAAARQASASKNLRSGPSALKSGRSQATTRPAARLRGSASAALAASLSGRPNHGGSTAITSGQTPRAYHDPQ
jgi:hypothetical protein